MGRNDWHPHEAGRRGHSGPRRPEVGAIVAYDRRAWEVRHVADAEPTPEEQERLDMYVEPYRTRHLPFTVTLRRVHGAPHKRENSVHDIGLRVSPRYQDPLPAYPHGRVPLCSCHGEPWPCLEADQQRQAEAELAKAEKAMNLMPGCCPACEEPITSRQKSITFGGPNVTNPLAEGPTYHLRMKCRGSAAQYEEAWVQAEPGRRRSLLTLRCEGHVIVHHDGSAECHGAAESDCPTVFARHRSYQACYLQSHGCPRECPVEGHSGTYVSGRPSDPRAILGEA